MKILNYNNILEVISKKNRVSRFIGMTIGSFIIALTYNAFAVPNNLVFGGISGLAIVASNQFGIPTTIFINVVTFICIIISFFLLGVKRTSYAVTGFAMYAIMIAFTEPFAHYFYFEFDTFFLTDLIYATIYGIGAGLLYRTGFNTGGSDTIVCLLQKYFHLPTAKSSNILNGIIIGIGAIYFGIEKTLYAILFLIFSNFIVDRILLGSSVNKICFIRSRNHNQIEAYLRDELDIGYTLIDSTNGIGIIKKTIIMCVIPTDRFYDFKHELIKIDKKAILISNDCYTVDGGRTNNLISI